MASSSMFSLTRSVKRIMTRARACGLVAAHSFCAFDAMSTAAATSSVEASTTWACTCPVLGSKTSAVARQLPHLRRWWRAVDEIGSGGSRCSPLLRQRLAGRQRWVKFGGRFSMKAAMPSV